MEARQRDYSRRVRECGQDGDPTEGDGDDGGEVIDGGTPSTAGFRDAGDDHGDDGEEYDDDNNLGRRD